MVTALQISRAQGSLASILLAGKVETGFKPVLWAVETISLVGTFFLAVATTSNAEPGTPVETA